MIKNTLTKEKALEGFAKGIDCSQTVFGEIAPQIGLDRQLALKIAAEFGGGMWQGETCGCVTGALMTLGLKYGQGDDTDPETKQVTLGKAEEFKAKFIEKNGSLICRELIGYTLPGEIDKVKEEHKFETVCAKAVVSACEILAEMMNGEDE